MSEDKFVSSYTSFSPLSPEAKSITSGFSFSRIFDFAWKKGKRSLPEPVLAEEPPKENLNDLLEENQQKNHHDSTKDIDKINQTSKENALSVPLDQVQTNFGKCKSENSSPNLPRKEKSRYRNVKTILRRLSAIAVDKKWQQTSGDFKHDFKQYWMPDEHCKECYECGGKFNTFRRRHHCRVCGQIFCSRCCSQEVPGQSMGFGGNIRVCNYCCKIVKAYLEDDIEKSLDALKEDMKICYDDGSETVGNLAGSLTSSRTSLASYHTRDDTGMRRIGSSNSLPGIIEREMRTQSTTTRNPFDAFGVTPKEAIDIKQDFLRDLWRQISDTGSKLELQSHRFRLKTYTNCFVGHELVDWLLTYGKAANRAQGVAIGQDLLDFGWIESVPATEEDVFKDEYMLYQPGKLAVMEMESQSSMLSRQDTDGRSSLNEDESESTSSVSVVDDDDETLPVWFRQISTETSETMTDMLESQSMGTPSLSRRISSSRHLDLDQATFEIGESKQHAPARELSLHMKLDYFDDEDDSEKQVRKEIYDQTNKLSLITHVPPPPLDTYVCVEGHPFVAKKKIPKVASAAHLVDDILRGVEFPKPRLLQQVDERDPFKDDHGETIARESLRLAATHHLHALLNQLIERDCLPSVWKDVIMPIVLGISEQVVPDVRRDDDMDIRQYVWFKKVAAGDKPECQVISGVVFPKNVVHKKMTCSFTQPKILMLSCAIEYQRVENKLTSIEPVVLQEYEFLKKFIARIVSLKPNIVLVEKTVARVAQNMLLEAGITLVHNIKSNVMENISRCTRAVVLQSMEQVTRPKLGSCQQFRLQKYHLPDGGIKTLMFFEGCAPDLGCSLVLHGGNKNTLTKVKAIMKYLIYVAYHLKLENKFLMDEFALPPSLEQLLPSGSVRSERPRQAVFKIAEEDTESLDSEEGTVKSVDLQTRETNSKLENSKLESSKLDTSKLDNMLEESKKFNELISKVILCSSPFCVYPLPYLLTEEGQNCGCRRFSPGQLYESRLLNNRRDNEGKVTSRDSDAIEKYVNPDLILRDPHPFTRCNVIPRPQDPMTKSLLADFRARGGIVDLKTYRDFEELHKERRKEVNIKRKEKEKLDSIVTANDESNKDTSLNDMKKGKISVENEKRTDCFDPYNHQKIAVLFSSYSSESHNAPKPCISPWAVFMEFYGRNDITLGGFLEKYCFRPSYICSSHNCDVPMVNHVRYFAHGNGSLYIHMRNLESPIPGYDRTILTWSWCKQCKQVTPVVPLSFESWSLSFAKYLELRFYGGKYTRRASAEPCGHSLHQDHYQYFSFANMVASFKYRPIELYEVIIPSAEVVIGKERQPVEWENDVEVFCSKADRVLIQIFERITDLRTIEIGASAIREQNVKEFQIEFQTERHHYEEFMQCLRMKVDSLLSSERRSSIEDPSAVSSTSEFIDVGDNLMLKPSEKTALMVGIANMLVNLKRKLCEIVLSWNSRLQEFIQQEKKREKATKPSSSPKSEEMRYPIDHPNAIPNEIGEYYPTVTQDETEEPQGSEDQNLQYTYIHAQTGHKPVSEVLLNNGAILRQTYLGNEPPKEYIASDVNDETLVTYGGGEIECNADAEAPTATECDLERASEVCNQEGINGDRSKLRIDLPHRDDTMDGEAQKSPFDKEPRNDREKVGSPYMVIKSPLSEEKRIDDEVASEMPNKEIDSDAEEVCDVSRKSSYNKLPLKGSNLKRTGSIQVERGSLSDITNDVMQTGSMSRMESEDSLCSNESKEHWMVESRDRSGTVINTMEGDNLPKYLRRKILSLGQSDETSSHHSSLFVEDGSDAESSDLMSMQDVLDFPDEDQSYMSEADEAGDGIKDIDCVSEIGLGESAVDYEPPEVISDDELVEPISITKKLKSLGVPVDECSECASCSSNRPNVANDNEESIDDREKQETNINDEMRANATFEEVTVKRERRFANRRRYPPLGISMDDDAGMFESKVLVEKSQGLESQKSEHKQSRINRVDMPRERRPLFGDSSSDSDEPGSTELERKENRGNSEQLMNDNFLKNDANGYKRMKNSRSEATFKTISKDDTDFQRLCFIEGRSLGHRRLQSAPVKLTEMKADQPIHAECGLPGSPFELLKNTPVQEQSYARMRSYSQGTYLDFANGQEELTRIAEKICQVDRKDLEMDDPEEIQYDESLDETLKSPDASSKVASEKNSKDGVECVENENDKKLEKIRGTARRSSDAEESELGSVSSSSTTLRHRGHARQRSLQYKGFGLTDSKDEIESSKSSTLENTQGSQGQKKGAEKMKKIISHLLPGSNFQPVSMPFPSFEHYLLPAGDSISVVINEKEPSSIIAYALSSIDYYNQLSQLRKLLSGPANGSDVPQAKQTSSPIRKEAESSEINTNEVVLRNRKPQSKTLRRPRSWAGVSIKGPLIEYQMDFPADLLGKETGTLDRCNSVLDANSPCVRNRMSLADQFLMSSGGQNDSSLIEVGMDSPSTVEFDDAKTDSIDGILDDKDDLESAIGDLKAELPEEKTGKKKDEGKPTIDYNIKLQFNDNAAKFYCNVYYAEQFRQLRELIFPEGEERYIQSLSRCVFWKARGGKSGSSFSKSLDDRFVMKQMSRLEVQSFVEFAPQYFQYMDRALKEKRPTTLAKILGVYRFGFKNSQSNATMKQDVLVMENVFYNRKVNKIFDLKGSVRSRYVHTSGKEEVLMDENLLEMICETPLFIRPHSKAVLSKAIHNDSEFLSSHSVMDYSLLVGIDEVQFELVVGIIDYIRTFTWDKKLESYVKSTGILGGQGKMPTVVSPAVYKTRFTEAMQRYFLMVPDKWTGFGADHN